MDQNDTVLLVIDYQERLMPVIQDQTQILECAIRLVDAFNGFEIPVLVTEQYPRGLGPTVPELKSHLKRDTKIIEKTQFSAYVDDIRTHETFEDRNHVVIIGVETHVCVYQTVVDLIEDGFEVTVVYDAIASRFETDRHIGIDAMRALGAQVKTSEMVIYQLMGDAKHPRFKDILKLVK